MIYAVVMKRNQITSNANFNWEKKKRTNISTFDLADILLLHCCVSNQGYYEQYSLCFSKPNQRC